jgi:hypothetical protein
MNLHLYSREPASTAQFMRREVIDIDEIQDLGVVVAQHAGLPWLRMPSLQGLGDLPGKIQRRDAAGASRHRRGCASRALRGIRQQQRLLQQTERIAGVAASCRCTQLRRSRDAVGLVIRRAMSRPSRSLGGK